MQPAGYITRAWRYEADVLEGRIPACKWVRLACERNRRDRELADAGQSPFRFDAEAAERVCRAAEQFPHVKGPKAKLLRTVRHGRPAWRWQTIELEPWQCWFFATVFGWVRRDDGLRRFTRVLFLVPRKNAKTTLLAVACLYMLTADGEIGADVYAAATKKDQARIVFDIAAKMARRTPQFLDYFGVVPLERELKVDQTGSQFSPLSADDKTLDGLNPSFAAVDELHAHRTRGVWDVLVTAQGSRDQPLLMAISTAGTNLGGICYEVWTYAQKVLERTWEDDAFFCVNYTIDEEDLPHWDTEPVLRKGNPNWGISVNPRTLLADARSARRTQSAINNFLMKHLNVWVRAASPWMAMDAWHACTTPGLRLEDLAGLDPSGPARVGCVVAVDLAEKRDIASVVAVASFADDTVRAVAQHFYPAAAVEASPVAQMSGWVHAGALIATDGDVQDFARLEDEIVRTYHTVRATRVVFDRALGAHLMQRLQARLGQDVILEVPQNVKTFNPAMQHLDRCVAAHRFQHSGDPVLAWMVSNVGAKRNQMEELYPVKAEGKDSPAKIDGAVALLMGVSQLLAGEELSTFDGLVSV